MATDNAKSFVDFMEGRRRLINKGYLGDAYPTLAGQFRMKHHGDFIFKKVALAAEMDSSNPFASARALNHFKLGIADLDDYSGDKVVFYHERPSAYPGHTIQVPETNFRNRKVPCL